MFSRLQSTIFTAWVIATLATPFMAAPAPAQGDDGSKPLAIASESVIDFGPVAKGEKLRHSFLLRNDGDAPLEITEVKPNCGCTVAEFDATIEPGESGQIHAVVDTANFKGPIAKSIQVFTNDAANPRITMVVKANIKVLVDAEPGYMRFVTVFGETDEDRAVTVWAAGIEDFQVTRLESPFSYLEVGFHEAEEGEGSSSGEGRQWVIDASLSAEAPPGPIADYLQVHTNHPKRKVVRIPVSGLVRPVLTVLPRVADFGRRDLSEPQVASLEIQNLGGTDVTLDEVVSDVAGLGAEIESIEDGRVFKVLLTLEPGMAAGPFQGHLTITTSSEVQPVLEVSVRGVVL